LEPVEAQPVNVIVEPTKLFEEQMAYLTDLEKDVKNAQKLLKTTAQLSSDTRKLKKALESFNRFESVSPDLQARLQTIGTDLEEWRKNEERGRAPRFGRELKEAAEAASVRFAALSSEPPTYGLEPLTVEVSFVAGTARLDYARLPLGECAMDPPSILEAREKFLQFLDGEEFSPEVYVERLWQAYRRCLLAERKPVGERIELVDLLPELAMLNQGPRFKTDPTRENFKPYGKVRLAYDLARLRKSGTLTHQGHRLSLGTATIGTTRQKDRVLYLEEGGRGQYYLTLAFSGEQKA
jgi:hypothetical protein